MKFALRALILVMAFLVTACPRLPGLLTRTGETAVTSPSQQVAPLQGSVDFGTPGRTTQATIGGEIAKGATVGLIDATTGYTVATTYTDSNGGFKLIFANGWQPTASTVYYLEAIKGLSAGTSLPNRVGADLARVRTLVVFQDGMWLSTSGLTILLNPTSTALSIILSLRNMTPAEAGRRLVPADLIGVMQAVAGTSTQPSPVNFPNTALLPPQMVTDAYLVVLDALAKDSDPFRSALLDTTDPAYNTLLNAPRVVSVAALNPVAQTIGGTLDILGSGFSATASENVVEFSDVAGGPIPAAVATVSADLARLTVTVPSGAVTGPVAVTVSGRKIIGPTFYLALQSGHEAIDLNGNLYVANETFGTIARITPQGQITTYVTGLTAPRALTLRQGKIYVTCAGTKKGVVVVDMAFPANAPVDFGTAGTIADPRGIAFDGAGRAYVSDSAANRLYRIDATASAPVTVTVTGDALNAPRGVAFGSDGRLYVANFNANNVLGVAMTVATNSGVSTIFKQGLSGPWGVAFDSVGNMYVSNNRGNSVYRWQKDTNTLAPYADMPTPGGLVADRSGYVYALDNFSNNLYRITALGDSALFASGLSTPTGVAKVGNTLYVLSRTNNSLVAIDTGTTALSTVARGFNQPIGLTYDSVRDCFYVSNIGNGTITRVQRSNGAVTTVITGLPGWGSGPAGIMYRNGKLYVAVYDVVRAYDVTNFGAGYTSTQSVLHQLKGLSKDNSASANTGSFYLATGTNHRILRVNGDAVNTGVSSKNGTNYVEVFKTQTDDANLNNPRDVAVDGSGNVWVANENSHMLTSYKPDGTVLWPAINSGTQPFSVNFDGTYVWVVNLGSKNIKAYNPATGTAALTLTCGTDTPRAIAFAGTTMYVACAEGIGTIPNYATGGTYGRITTLGANSNDLEVASDGSIYLMRNQGYRIPADLSSEIQWITNYDSPNFLWKIPGVDDFYYNDYYRFGKTSSGNHTYRMSGSRRDSHGYRLAGIDSNGNLYIQGGTTCSGDAVSRIQTGARQKEWWYTHYDSDCYDQTQGAFAADDNGNFFIGVYQSMSITKVDASGTPTTVNSGLSSSFTSYGLWADPTGSTLYQTSSSHHRVDLINVGTGARTIQPYGLSGADM